MRAPSGFDWDDGNRAKCRKHGVSLREIEFVLSGNPRFAPDIAHSALEDRFIAVGRTKEKRAVFIAFTFRTVRGKLLIRPVSARYMHRKEASAYEEASPQSED